MKNNKINRFKNIYYIINIIRMFSMSVTHTHGYKIKSVKEITKKDIITICKL